MMTGFKTRALPAWMLSVTTSAGLCLVPALTFAQAPTAAPAAPAPATAGQSPVQQELRRLYSESGREMPEIPANVQAQATALPSSPAPGAAPQVIVTPAPSAPARPNPVIGFFKKLVPGSQNSQKTPGAEAATPKPSAPTAISPRYTPFAAQPPRRLPAMDAAPAVAQPISPAPQTVAAPKSAATPLPPSPAAAIEPAAPAPLVAVPVTAPVIVSTPETPPAPLVREPEPVIAPGAAPEVARADDFPDPFTEMSEEEADEEALEEAEEQETPFTGLTLEDGSAESSPSPAVATQPAEPAPQLQVRPQAAVPATSDPILGAPVLPQPRLTEAERPLALPSAAAAPTVTPASAPSMGDDYAAKMQKIRERDGMKGLKGFCPVTLRDQRELKDALPEFASSYRGQKFHFASDAAKARFDADPTRYAPAAYGADVVVLIRDKDVAEGTLDYAAWFKGRLYLFASEENSNAFLADPAKFATPAGLE